MINRVWRGWSKAEYGDAYERLLRQEIFPGIAAKNVPGYKGIQLLRRQLPSGEFEFMTIMRFDSLESVKAFAAADYERAYVPDAARRVLSRFQRGADLLKR